MDIAVLSPCSISGSIAPPAPPGLPISCNVGRSTLMVLVAGQYEAPLVGLASAQGEGAKDNDGVDVGTKTLFMISINTAMLSSSRETLPLIGSSGSSEESCCNATGSSPRRLLISSMLIFAHVADPLSKPIWNALTRSSPVP